MAEMMATQMKKIEELTLHLIEQNKMVMEQNKQNSKLADQVALLQKKIEKIESN